MQPEQQNKTYYLKQQGKVETETTRKSGNKQAEDNAGHSATRVAEQNK